MSWDPTIGSFGNVLSVKHIKPNREKHEVGRVSAVFHDYAIIDETVIVSNSSIGEEICLWELYEYEAIETSCEVENRSYYWRLTKLIKRVESEYERGLKENTHVQLHDVTFSLRLDLYRPVKKFVSIYNNSKEPIKLVYCEVSSSSGLVQIDHDLRDVNFPSGKHSIYLKIIPKLVGSFIEELTVDFGNYQKKCLVKIEVKSDALEVTARKFNSESREIIPGQKVRVSPRFVDVRISSYLIPDSLREIDFKKNTQLLMRDLNDFCPFLFERLTRENYLPKMRYCLYLEEIAMEIHFARYKIERAHFENKQEYLRLVVEGVAEKRPSLSIGDFVHATDPFPSTKQKSTYEGNIHKVEQNAVLLKFHTDFHHSHGRRDFRIEFRFSRTSFRRQQHSLDMTVKQGGLGYDFLFPNIASIAYKRPQVNITSDKEINWFNENLNKYQKAAVVNVLRGEARPLPYIIFGPPGTGKTQTVIECIEQIADKIPSSRIIVAAPSNSAANLIIDRLIATGRFKGGDIIRFVSFNQIEKNLIPEHLKKYCATIDIGFDDGKAHNMTTDESGLRFNCSKSVIVQYKIYVSTLSSLGPLMQIKFMQDHFTHVIIDEAGQSVETETLIPINFVSKNKGQVILAGDPQQLGPILVSQVAKLCGFDKSLLERLSEHEFYQPLNGDFDNRFVTKLKKNYRSLPSILGIYNHLFYEGELEAEVNDEGSPEIQLLTNIDEVLWNRGTADRKCGVYFVNVSKGRNMRTVESSSWFNDQEAAQVFKFVCKLKQQGIAMSDVGIVSYFKPIELFVTFILPQITPYALQVKKLRHIIDTAIPNCGLKVGTVEEFQGQERQIILVTTVRTNANLLHTDVQFSLGFLQCKKRMNVAISRARALLVVFGKESILGQDESWNHLIQYSKKMGTYASM
jgi:RNA helicase armi